MDHAVNIAAEPDEQTEFGDILNLALDITAGRMAGSKSLPRIVVALFQAEANPPFLGIDLQHHDIHFLAGGNDFAGMDVLFRPAHFRHMDQAFHTGLQLHEGAVVGDVTDAASELGADRIFQLHPFPRIRI